MKFSNEFYNQIKDTGMGTIFAETYATSSKVSLKSDFIISVLLNMANF